MLKAGVKVVILCVFCCLLSEVVSQAQSSSKDTKIGDTEVGTAEVTGQATLDGEPARGIVVLLQPRPLSGSIGQYSKLRSKTDVKGRYRITGISAGQYSIGVLAPGYVVAQNAFYLVPLERSINISN